MPEPRAIVPEKSIRPGRNASGATIAKAIMVALVAAGGEDPNQIQLPGSAGVKCYGATMSPILNGQIGDIQTAGRARVLVGAGGVAVGQPVSATTAGAVVVATSGQTAVGTCVVAGAAGVITEIELAGPGAANVIP